MTFVFLVDRGPVLLTSGYWSPQGPRGGDIDDFQLSRPSIQVPRRFCASQATKIRITANVIRAQARTSVFLGMVGTGAGAGVGARVRACTTLFSLPLMRLWLLSPHWSVWFLCP